MVDNGGVVLFWWLLVVVGVVMVVVIARVYHMLSKHKKAQPTRLLPHSHEKKKETRKSTAAGSCRHNKIGSSKQPLKRPYPRL